MNLGFFSARQKVLAIMFAALAAVGALLVLAAFADKRISVPAPDGSSTTGDTAEEQKSELFPEDAALEVYNAFLSGDRSLLDSEDAQTWWIPDFQDGVLVYEYTFLDLDGDGGSELLVQMKDAPSGYNGVFHFADGRIFCWNSDAVEMSSQSIPLADGTMVSRYEFSGTVSHTVFRYLPDGSREEITAFFSREELPDPDSTDPCPFYTVNGEETDPDTFYARLQERITDKMLPSSAWTEV